MRRLATTQEKLEAALAALSSAPGPGFRTGNDDPFYLYLYVFDTLYHRTCRAEPPTSNLAEDQVRYPQAYPLVQTTFWPRLFATIRTKYALASTGRTHDWHSEHLPGWLAFLRAL